jgi:subtilisin family serine protease
MEEEVQWISLLPPSLEGVNDGIRQSIHVNDVHQAPYLLDGSRSNILVYDVGAVDLGHPDLSGRVVNGEGGGFASHSTHVAGTVAGDGTNNANYKGMAPDANIISYTYESCSPNCLYNSPQDIEGNYEEGLIFYRADLSTNSIGSNIAFNGYPCSWEGDYELTAQLLDAITHGDWGPGVPYASVWAAGNERAGACGTQYNTTGVPATAKNTIVVGATNSNDHSMTYFSSWGPVDDGRMRPDVCAPGCQIGGDGGIRSTEVGGGYSVKCGTSMATPATAGVLALILQEWRQGPIARPRPLPSTLKVILANTAVDYGNPGPDYQFGYGEIRADDAVDHLRNGFALIEANLDHGQEKTYAFQLEGDEPLLRATLAWSDVPGALLAQKELVNDLDAWFEDPQGGIHRPYVLNPANPGAAAGLGIDVRNPSEQIEVDDPEAGLWTLHIAGTTVPEGPQSFSVAVNQRLGQAPSGVEEAALSGVRAVLEESRPNPFNPRTLLRFRLASDEGRVGLKVFSASGRLIRTLVDGPLAAGAHEATWDGTNDDGRAVPSGVYFSQLELAGETMTRSMVLLK